MTRFVRLTLPYSDEFLWVQPAAVATVRRAVKGGSRIVLIGEMPEEDPVLVKESPQEVIQKLLED